MRSKLIFILITLVLASCALKPYKMDIHQGNLVTAEMRDKLKLGMTKTQVKFVLGTPMVNDVFHANRWDYVYRLERGGKLLEQQGLTLTFAGDKLQRIDDGKQVQQATPEMLKEAATPTPAVEPQVNVTPDSIVEQGDEDNAVSPMESNGNDIQDAIQAWADAWSSQNLEDYFASYADHFKPDGLSKSAWQKQRRNRISKPKTIQVALSDIKVEQRDETHASATFKQDYRADAYHDAAQKIVQLEKIDGAWLIVTEKTVGRK